MIIYKNYGIQKVLVKKEIEGNEGIYREKDKVIQLSNMKDESVFNGDIGIIDRIKLLGNRC